MFDLKDMDIKGKDRFTWKETLAMIIAAYKVFLPKLLVPVAALLFLSVIAKVIFKY